MTIRELTPADIPELRALAIKIFRDTFTELNTPENLEAFLERDYSIEAFEREFKEADSRYFFISEEKPIGYLRLRSNPEVEHLLGTNTIEVHRLYVDKNFHGKKVGDQLMQLAIDTAAAGKFDWIWLGVWSENPRAQRFYEKWGFERFSEHAFFMGDERQTDFLLKRKP